VAYVFFVIILYGLHCFLYLKSKSLNDAQSFLLNVLSTKLFFCNLFSLGLRVQSITGGIMLNRWQLQWWTHRYQGCQLKRKNAGTQKYLRCLGNLCSICSRVAYINVFNTNSCSFQSAKRV